jgi:glycosyltransferase involved in cell wall biosynthesis
MTHKTHLLVLDPIAFIGGSKIATANILRLLDVENTRITVLSGDPQAWQLPNVTRVKLNEAACLSSKEQGLAYFLRHIYIALVLLITRLRFGKFELAIGASGPGVDLALYLIKPLLNLTIMQLVHGPVASSRTIGRCLLKANQVYYLESSQASLKAALVCISQTPIKRLPSHFELLKNGLPKQNWPSPCQTTKAVVFWSASLLKWKGLETLLDALTTITAHRRPTTHICYIKPKDSLLPISQAPIPLQAIQWHHNPDNLDAIRASANIFVSTSIKEPFGLAILEALAAGHCVLIPKDNAYWDRHLTDNINCIKYTSEHAIDLSKKLLALSQDIETVRQIGRNGAALAHDYCAENQYANIKNSIQKSTTKVTQKANGYLGKVL